MDKKDKKILAELITNSRIPFNQLGKKVGLSREVVAYRINRLIEEKIITDFYPIINLEKLNYFRNGCWIQLKDIGEAEERLFFSFLNKHPFVTYIGTIVGKWNVSFDILSRDRTHLVKVVQEILDQTGNNIERYIITNNSAEQEIYPTKVIGIIERKKSPSFDNKRVKLDQIDKHLLELISINSRIDYVELSSKTNLSANAVKYRIKKLEKAGVINGYTISIDAIKLGYEYYNLQLKLNPSMNENKIKEFLRVHPNVTYFYRYFGHENWDIDIGIIAKNSKELRDIIMDFRNNLRNMIIIHDIYNTLEIVKANFAPKGIFN